MMNAGVSAFSLLYTHTFAGYSIKDKAKEVL